MNVLRCFSVFETDIAPCSGRIFIRRFSFNKNYSISLTLCDPCRSVVVLESVTTESIA